MAMNNKPVSYLQTSSKWRNVSYSTKYESTTIGASGCGPTAMAMVIATWVDPTVTPVTTCKWSLNHGYKATGNGTYHSYFVPQAAAYGLKCERINTTSISYMYAKDANKCHQAAHDAVEDGNLVICLMGKGNWTKGGHYILWYSNDGDDVLINDPASTKSNRIRNKFELLKSEARFYWIVRVPEEVISMTNTEVEKLIERKAAEAASSAISEYAASKVTSGYVPSDWAKDDWYAACIQGLLDGSNPKSPFTREQFATVARRLGFVEAATCPDGFIFGAGSFKE